MNLTTPGKIKKANTAQASRVSNRSGYIVGSLLLVLVIAVVIVSQFINPDNMNDYTALVLYSSILVLISALQILVGYTFRLLRPDQPFWLHPPFLLITWFNLAYCLFGLYGFLDRGSLIVLTESIGINYPYAAAGMMLILIGCFCIWVSYITGILVFKPFRFIKAMTQIEPKLSITLIFYAVSLAFQLLRILVTGISYGQESSSWGPFSPFNQWFSYIEDLKYLLIVIVATQVFRKRWSPQPLLMIVLIQCILGFTSGAMKPILWLAAIIIMTAAISKIKVGFLLITIALPLIFLSILVVPIAETLRAESDSFNGRDPGQVLTATATAYQDSWGKGFSTGWAIFTKKVIGRQAVVAYTPGIIMYRTPSLIPYQGIDKFLNVVTYIIPRALWQDKPDLNVGPKFGQDYFRAPHDTENSPAMTVFGEGYIFAGWAGTVLACSILGLLLAFLFQNTVSAGIPIIFLALTPSLVDVEGQFTTIAVGIVEKAPIFLVAYWILIKLSNRQNNSTSKNLVKIRTH